MDFDIPWRRIGTGSAVLLFHILLVYLLALALHIHVPAVHAMRETIISLMPPNGSRTHYEDLHIPTPKMIAPPIIDYSTITIPPVLKKNEQNQNPNPPADLKGVGSYLYNCSEMFYEQLPGRERMGCLFNRWDRKPSNQPLLGVQKASPYDALMARKQEQPAEHGVEQRCDPGALNANLGIPCFTFPRH